MGNGQGARLHYQDGADFVTDGNVVVWSFMDNQIKRHLNQNALTSVVVCSFKYDVLEKAHVPLFIYLLFIYS